MHNVGDIPLYDTRLKNHSTLSGTYFSHINCIQLLDTIWKQLTQQSRHILRLV